MARLRDRRCADGVDAQLLAELTPEFGAFHPGNVTARCGSRSPSTIAASSSASACSRRSCAPGTSRSISGPTRRSRESTIPTRREEIGGAIRNGDAERGILVCGSGVGASVAASKLAGIRAAICHDTYSAHQGVEHDDMNVLCLGSEVIGAELAGELVRTFLGAEIRRRRTLRA